MKKLTYLLLLGVLSFCICIGSCGVDSDEPINPPTPPNDSPANDSIINKPIDPPNDSLANDSILLDNTGNVPVIIDLGVEEWTATTDVDWIQLKQEGTKLLVTAEMWLDSPNGTKEKVQERETEIREGEVFVELNDSNRTFPVKQENIYVGKFAEGGIIYWLNSGDNKIAEEYPDCKGLVLSLEESPFLRAFLAYDLPANIKDARKPSWTIKKLIEDFKTKYLPFSSADGQKATKHLLDVCETIINEEDGTLPPFEEYADWNFMERTIKNSKIYYGPNYVWFKERYWQKTRNGYSDWYIATLEEMSPLFRWEEFLFMDIKALILSHWEDNIEYDDISIIPLDSKFKKPTVNTDRDKGVSTPQEDELKTMLSSVNSFETGPASARFIDFTNHTTGQYSAFDNEDKFNKFISSGTALAFNSVIRPIRRF